MITYTFNDKKDDDKSTAPSMLVPGTVFLVNGDFSGNVKISRGGVVEIEFPYWQLRALVAEEIRYRKISILETANVEELLGLDYL